MFQSDHHDKGCRKGGSDVGGWEEISYISYKKEEIKAIRIFVFQFKTSHPASLQKVLPTPPMRATSPDWKLKQPPKVQSIQLFETPPLTARLQCRLPARRRVVKSIRVLAREADEQTTRPTKPLIGWQWRTEINDRRRRRGESRWADRRQQSGNQKVSGEVEGPPAVCRLPVWGTKILEAKDFNLAWSPKTWASYFMCRIWNYSHRRGSEMHEVVKEFTCNSSFYFDNFRYW